MKNKHIVLLFLLTLGIGLLMRRLPWHISEMFQTTLIRVDTAEVTRISIVQPDHPELLFERTDEGWAVSQDDRSVSIAAAVVAPMLAVLTRVESLRILQTEQPDTLGLGAGNALHITVQGGARILEKFSVGLQILEKNEAATFIWLGEHEGVYLVKNHLRDVFSQKMEDFRNATPVAVDPAAIRAVSVEWPGDSTFLFQKNDSLQRWQITDSAPSVPDDSMQAWLGLWAHLPALPFADDFDEGLSQSLRCAQFSLHLTDREPLVLRLYRVIAPELREEFPARRNPMAQLRVAWVLHSSQNPRNYFLMPDTLLARNICEGFPMAGRAVHLRASKIPGN